VAPPADPPKPAGFGNCGVCPYKVGGTVDLCYSCASRTLEELDINHCRTCDGKLKADGRCGNPLCNRPESSRGWAYIHAISQRSGPLRRAINSYKHDDRWGWAYIFGRVLVGYLDAEEESFREYDHIIPMPTYVGKGGRSRDHTAYVIERARVEDDSWPFRLDLMRKTRSTPNLADLRGGFVARAHVAETQIGPALEVLKPRAVRGKRILVFDDVFTAGLTLREVAHKLHLAGATMVSGVVLARQPFRR
jgi:predicted amidophosphoribosyltransferase